METIGPQRPRAGLTLTSLSEGLAGWQVFFPTLLPWTSWAVLLRTFPLEKFLAALQHKWTLPAQAQPTSGPTSLCSLQILHSHRGRFWPGEASIPHLVQTFYKREGHRRVSILAASSWAVGPGQWSPKGYSGIF